MSTTEIMPANALDAPELAGYRDFWAALPAPAAAALGMAHAELGGAHCVTVTALPEHRLLNHALGLPADRPLSADHIAVIEKFFVARGQQAPLGLAEGALAEAQVALLGFQPEYAWMKFARDVSPLRNEVGRGLTVRPVPPSDALCFGEILAAGFFLPTSLTAWFSALVGRPGWHCLGGYDGHRLVATGCLYAHGDSGWITWGATDAAHRGRGAQKALLTARISLAASLGLRWLVTETGAREPGKPDASYRNILAAGFEPAYRRTFWCHPRRSAP